MTKNIKNKSDELISKIMNEAIKETLSEYDEMLIELDNLNKEIDR